MVADARARFSAAAAGRDVAWLPGGMVGLVADAGDVVLKVLPRGHEGDAELVGEGRALAAWAPTGAVVRLLDVRDGGFTLMLERLRPGVPLDASPVSPDDRLRVLGGLVRRLHATPPPPGTARIAEYGRSWRRALAGTPEQAEFERLAAPGPDDVLLHADLHGGNALSAGDGWRVIDPHAVAGDRHADVWALIDPLAPPLPDPAEAHRRVRLYAAAAGLDPARAAAWTRIRALAEALAIDADPAPDPADVSWAVRLHTWAAALR